MHEGSIEMKFLERERTALERLIPGLDAKLAEYSLTELEGSAGVGLSEFVKSGGPALLVPVEHDGRGASLLNAVRIQRALGARSPSLAVATTMHHFSVASLVESTAQTRGMEWMLLAAIAKDGLLVASGFAEGRTGQGILSSTISARITGDTVWLNGSKKPCSLSRSMDLLTASVALPTAAGKTQLAIALIPAGTPGVSIRPFWESPILAATESDEVVLDDVQVPGELLIRTNVTDDGRLDDLQTIGFVWFELLMTASYLGAASALVERLLGKPSTPSAIRSEAAIMLESAALSLEGVAASPEPIGTASLAAALMSRYAAQDAIARAVSLSAEGLGGMAFISSGDIAYLNSACRALAFHPPSRASMATPLADALSGAPLRIP